MNRIYTLGYGFNWRTLDDPNVGTQHFFTQIKVPSNQLVIADSTEDLRDQDIVDWIATGENVVNPRHPSSTVNVGFADLHAGAVSYNQLVPQQIAGSQVRYWREY